MNKPLTDYFINSSYIPFFYNNFEKMNMNKKLYLNLLKTALYRGCRYIEIECWVIIV